MANLQGFKEYARVDDDDSSLKSMLTAAKLYIDNAGVPEQQDNELYDLLVYMIALNWYTNRGVTTTERVNDIPRGASNILGQLRQSI